MERVGWAMVMMEEEKKWKGKREGEEEKKELEAAGDEIEVRKLQAACPSLGSSVLLRGSSASHLFSLVDCQPKAARVPARPCPDTVETCQEKRVATNVALIHLMYGQARQARFGSSITKVSGTGVWTEAVDQKHEPRRIVIVTTLT